jgi:hypothetical protein
MIEFPHEAKEDVYKIIDDEKATLEVKIKNE